MRGWLKHPWIVAGTVVLLAGALVTLDAFWRSRDSDFQTRNSLLHQMPASAHAVFFADVQQLRRLQFAQQFSRWIPNVAADPEYSDFQQRTGFDFERDLRQIAVAALGDNVSADRLFAVASGHFDANKLQEYAAQAGHKETRGELQIFSFDLADGQRASLSFVSRSTVALTNAPELAPFLAPHPRSSDSDEWNARFDRLAGSPLFAVIHQSTAARALPLPIPSGFQSPQLSALLDRLQWITIAARSQDSNLQVVAEGECDDEQTSRQLADFLNGILVMAQAGLDTSQIRRELAPATREAYLDLAKSAEITRLDRGRTKSVRVVFDVTPKLLEAIRTAPPTPPVSTPLRVAETPKKKKSIESSKKK
jgi:hypothetical protein